MKKTVGLGIMTLFATSLALAQPPEEVPPPPPENAGEGIVAPAPVAQPVAEPQKVEAKAPEDDRIKGITITPAVGFFPLGYDSVDVTGSGEGGRYFFWVRPKVDIGANFKTSTDRKLTLGLTYELDWREYYNKNITARDFQHEVEGDIAVEWNDVVSTDIDTVFDYFFKVGGSDAEGDNSLVIDSKPMMLFKVNDQVKLKMGYQLQYINLIDTTVDPSGQNLDSGPPSDADDLIRGGYTSTATGFDNFGSGSTDLFGNPGAVTATKQTWDLLYNRAVFAGTYSPIKGTTLGAEYRFGFYSTSNIDGQELNQEHFIIPSIKQKLPTGGVIALKDELRLRKYKYATIDAASDVPLQKMRNRLTLTIDQPINDFTTFEAYFRLELLHDNKAGSKYNDNYKSYIGVNFAF